MGPIAGLDSRIAGVPEVLIMSDISRRGFVRQLLLKDTAEAPTGRTLVCVFLRGGADTLNMLVPYGDDQYYSLRPTIAIPAPVNGVDKPDGAVRLDGFYALHPKLRPLLPIYEEVRLAFVQGVGSDNPTGSHFEAQDQMEHGEEYGKALGGGWLGRHLQTRASLTPLSAVSIGPIIPESLRSAPTASALSSLDDIHIKVPSGSAVAISQALKSMYGEDAGALGPPGLETLDLLRRVEGLRGQQYKPESNASYPDNSFGSGLREIARIIKAEVGLEIACLDLGGWDTHFFQGKTDGVQAEPIDSLARGLAAFDADINRYGDQVVTMVMTEFGRRAYENSSLGTDHGRGFALFAMGNKIHGGKVHGEWPGLGEDDLPGPGGLKIRIDYRSVLAEILGGFLGNRDVKRVFPDLKLEPIGLLKV
jgi:uncharacterized protein (DUF1501 family)